MDSYLFGLIYHGFVLLIWFGLFFLIGHIHKSNHRN